MLTFIAEKKNSFKNITVSLLLFMEYSSMYFKLHFIKKHFVQIINRNSNFMYCESLVTDRKLKLIDK